MPEIALTPKNSSLINFLHSWTTSPWSWASGSRHSTFRHATTCSLIYFHHDRIDHTLNFFLLGFELIFFSQLIFVQPVQSLLHGLLNFFLVSIFKLVLQLLLIQSVSHCEAVVFQTVFGLYFYPVGLIFI